jgi:hypothetical protein
MTAWNDHFGEMTAIDPPSAQFLDDLRVLADIDAPEPTDELEQLFASTLPLEQRGRVEAGPADDARRPRAYDHPLLTAAAAVVLGLALLIAGAVTHRLPAYAQRLVSNVVNTLTPFHIDPVRTAPAPRPSKVRPSGRPAQQHPSTGSGTAGTPQPSASAPGSPTRSVGVVPPPRSRSRTATPSASPSAPSSGRSSPSGTETSAARSPAATTGSAPGKALGRGHTGHPAAPGLTRGAGNGPGSAHGSGHGAGTGVGGGRPAPSTSVPAGHGVGHGSTGGNSGKGTGGTGHRGGRSVHVRVEVGVAEASLGITPGSKGGEVVETRVRRAHARRVDREHLAPVWTRVERL